MEATGKDSMFIEKIYNNQESMPNIESD